MSQISSWLRSATRDLKAHGIDSARLDAEIILAHTLRKNRTWLHAHGDETIDSRLRDIAEARIDLRREHVPIAYIIGHKEFYGRRFVVTPNVLVPRPESEVLIELLKQHVDTTQLFAYPPQKLVDIGTGSGILGITAKLELPEIDVSVSDSSQAALSVAKKNAQLLGAPVTPIRGDLLTRYPFSPNYIIANLPYVDPAWQHGSEIMHEPSEALFADEAGLALIYRLIDQASQQLADRGLLILEADPRQFKAICDRARARKFQILEQKNFGLALQRTF